MNHSINILRIKSVYNALGKLNEKIVFAGGATVSLYADRIGFDVRQTDDVDVIIEILNYKERADLEERLRALGFDHDIHSKIVCRYKIQGITVDIMPTSDDSIGFKNIWYTEGFHNSVDFFVDDQTSIKMLSVPYFIATKLEAFKGRGNGDGRTSHDFEDIIYILENRSTIWEELNATGSNLNGYLKKEFTELLANRYIRDWIESHVERSGETNTEKIIKGMNDFVL